MAEGDPNCDPDELRAELAPDTPEDLDLEGGLRDAEAEAAAHADDEAEIAEDVAELDATMMVFEAVAISTVSGRGDVTCPAPPFNCKKVAGRITTWPQTKPVEFRSVGCKCSYHPGCSVTRARCNISDNDLLCWLFSHDFEALRDASPAALKELGRRHMAAFRNNDFPTMDVASGSGV
eukprot:5629054-Pyramimonas_sp.AAC.1